ncbi:MAG: OmpH family outer membrane protein [Deltaproteobacteria bacterium]|nr:OmpH family outer membrane protein [Deltaproteobacteria bacterium]
MTKLGKLIAGVFMVSVFLLSGICADAAEKTGFINMQEIIRGTEIGKKAEADFRTEVDKKRSLIQAKEAELQKLKDGIEKQGSILTEKARKEKEASYQEKFNSYQRIVKEANDEIQNKQKDVFDTIIPDIMKIVNAIGQKENYTTIFDLSIVPVAYFDKKNDLTKQVIDEVNKTLKPKK